MGKASAERLRKTLEGNWQTEMAGFYTYTALADREAEPVRCVALRHMASAEKHHAELWGARYRALGGGELVYAGRPAGDAETLATN